MDILHVFHNVLEGPAFFNVQPVTCFLVSVPGIYHDPGCSESDGIAATAICQLL
jgi:hypothetical protein